MAVPVAIPHIPLGYVTRKTEEMRSLWGTNVEISLSYMGNLAINSLTHPSRTHHRYEDFRTASRIPKASGKYLVHLAVSNGSESFLSEEGAWLLWMVISLASAIASLLRWLLLVGKKKFGSGKLEIDWAYVLYSQRCTGSIWWKTTLSTPTLLYKKILLYYGYY